MNRYTDIMSGRYGDLDAGNDSFEEDLLSLARTFRSFSEALNDFIVEKGYFGDVSNIGAKVDFIKAKFREAGMQAPREVQLWFSDDQPIVRDTAFQLCFAFGLDLDGTELFFRKVFSRERCFDCHSSTEAVYYWCIRNNRNWQTVQNILAQIPIVHQGRITDCEVLYTGAILHELDQLLSEEQLIAYLTENQNHFSYNNATATMAIQKLWNQITAADGLLAQESRKFGTMLTKVPPENHIKVWDAYLAIIGISKQIAKELPGDRTIKAVADQLPKAIADSFPSRQGIEKLLRGQHVDYEIVRKWLILLSFYDFWCRLALRKGNYYADADSEERCHSVIDQHLTDAGYMELYPGNPYDWVFLYSCNENEPLKAFRTIWQSLTERYLADASEKPD